MDSDPLEIIINMICVVIITISFILFLKEKTMRVLLVALLLSVGACADKGYEALPNHNHIECLGSCDVKIK